MPGVESPYNFAGRHNGGINELNLAANGAANVSSTTIGQMPALAGADLVLFETLSTPTNGTVKLFRLWDEDVEDAGIVEATS